MRHVRFPWLALAFAAGVGAVALMPAAVPGSHLVWLAGASLVLVLALDGVGPRPRLVMALVCAGAVRMAAARLEVERAPVLPAGVLADDRGLDTLVGTVAGPVDDRAQQRAFPLLIEGATARVWITVRGPRAHAAAPVLPGDRVRVR